MHAIAPIVCVCVRVWPSCHRVGCGRYGTWFGVEGLVDAGVALEHPSIKRACEFLVSKQKEDGGWGETFESCVTRKYVQHPKSQVVNTAWAVLVLLKAKYVDAPHRPCARAPCMGCPTLAVCSCPLHGLPLVEWCG